jgi:hypothetical protein
MALWSAFVRLVRAWRRRRADAQWAAIGRRAAGRALELEHDDRVIVPSSHYPPRP